ncbi:MAG: S41 family peptidase [Cyanobacteriota/Melainabacteria group bacterium]
MKRTRHMIVGFLGIAMALTFLFAPVAPGYAQTNAPAAATQQQPFDGPILYKEVFERLKRFHIELRDPQKREAWAKEWENKYRGKLTDEAKTDEAIHEMVNSLEQIHDHYLPPADWADMNKKFKPGFAGVGIAVEIKGQLEALKALPENPTEAQVKEAYTIDTDKRPFIVGDEPMDGLPAQSAGIQKGDIIVAVKKDAASKDAAVPLNGKTSDEAVDLIRGKIDSEVVLTIRRGDGNGGFKPDFDVTIKRATVVPKVTKVKDLGDGVTQVRLFNFSSENVETEMTDALQQAAKGKALVLDLRGNPGGRLEAAKSVVAKILETGVIVTKRERNGDGWELETTSLLKDIGLVEYKDTTDPNNDRIHAVERATLLIPRDMPVVVLVNGGSASASEITSGALQGRAVIVGTPTYGKGVGQAVMPLPWERGVNITTFEFLPQDRAMNMVGVIPDIEVEQPADERFDPNKDTQLETAKQTALDMLAKAEALSKKAEELRTEKLENWKKAIEARKQQP